MRRLMQLSVLCLAVGLTGCGFVGIAITDALIYQPTEAFKYRLSNGPIRVAGRVVDQSGRALTNVSLSVRVIRITGKIPDWSETATWTGVDEHRSLADGTFDVAVDEGYAVDLAFMKPGLQPLCRRFRLDPPRLLADDDEAFRRSSEASAKPLTRTDLRIVLSPGPRAVAIPDEPPSNPLYAR